MYPKMFLNLEKDFDMTELSCHYITIYHYFEEYESSQ